MKVAEIKHCLRRRIQKEQDELVSQTPEMLGTPLGVCSAGELETRAGYMEMDFHRAAQP